MCFLLTKKTQFSFKEDCALLLREHGLDRAVKHRCFIASKKESLDSPFLLFPFNNSLNLVELIQGF